MAGDRTEVPDGEHVSDDKQTGLIGSYTIEYLTQRAKEMVEERTNGWEITDLKAEERIPKFKRDEIKTGGVFGKGGFFVVTEVKQIALEDTEGDASGNGEESAMLKKLPKDEAEDYIQGVVQDRRFMQKHCLRNGRDCRYAFKTMQEQCKNDPTIFVNTMVDLAIEAKFLSAVRHPNIIKMRATSEGDLCQPNAFLVLDRLYDTLTDRLKKWKKKDQNGFSKLFDFQNKRENSFFAKRLAVAYDVASAFRYLHDLNIIYRDLKPNNVGFDVRDDCKLFDFGLATEFDSHKAKSTGFKLTGDTGTVRYMAPEVALNQPYKETADVYSFGILLWQICSMEMPYGTVADDTLERKVVYCGLRPKVDQKWPNSIRRLLQDCFASSPRRPQMEVVCDVLRHEINELSDKKLIDEDVVDSTRSAMSARYYG